MNARSVERFTHVVSSCANLLGQKEIFYVRKRFNTKRIGLEHQHGRRYVVLVQPYGGSDVM